MKKLLALLLIIPFLFLVTCEEDPIDDPPVDKPPVDDPYVPGWNDDVLTEKYGKEFGWDSASLGALKAPIEHNMLAEEYFFAKGLNAGWNLGNTYDLGSNPRVATGHYDKLFAGVKAAGFNVLRLPVSWGSTFNNTTNPNAVSDWLDQIEQTVTLAHAAGLVVFVNTHHDKGYFSLDQAGASYKEAGDAGTAFINMSFRFENVWRHIAERFKDYGDWLLFEPINEPTIGNPPNWDGAPPEYHEVLNRWNQLFVETVRETGGNNEKRYLIFKSYAGKLQPWLDTSNGYRLPEDPAGTGRLVYSFHSYVPQPLGLEGQGYAWTRTHLNSYTSMFKQVSDAFILKGIPVFMGETGATFHSQRFNDLGSSVVARQTESTDANNNRLLLLNGLGHEARRFGVIPVLWDNGEATRGAGQNQPNGETFALFRRKVEHDNDPNNWGKPIDHTILNGGSNHPGFTTGGAAMNAGNAARDDADFGVRTIEAFIDAINGRTKLGEPRFDPKVE